MIEDVVDRWHRHLRGELPGGLDALLAEDVVFYSPVVYTPQRGKEITARYLAAAAAVLAGTGSPEEPERADGRFRYTRQVAEGDTAVLEFETDVDGTYVNGVDILRCDQDGRIVEFRVMLRPLRGISAVHERMRAALQAT